MNSKALESFLIPTTEGLFDVFKNKPSYTPSQSFQPTKKDKSQENANPKFLIGGASKPYSRSTYIDKSKLKDKYHYFNDISKAVNKAGQKIKTIAKSKKSLWDQTPKGIETYLNAVFGAFINSKEWKDTCKLINIISAIELDDDTIDINDFDAVSTSMLEKWEFIYDEKYLNCDMYTYDLIYCDQDQFFYSDDIISYLLDCAVSIFDNVTANCFADDHAAFDIVIHK